ncbi:unnamed protein product [Rhizophagus irregularis]|nr:unnamed protein product [Rhizophagus irregularis]
MLGLQRFFQRNEFIQIHTPIITTSDCEGGGEVFKLTTSNITSKQEFFGKPVYLTVAENSFTSKHLSEFWMLESEISFITSLNDLYNFVENSIKYIIQFLLDNSYQDIDYFNQFIDNNLLNRLENTLKNPFITMSYNDAIDILKKNSFDISFGSPLQSDHEKFLSTTYCNSPLFVINYPKK